MVRAVKKPPYCPDYGDIIWIDFNSQVGREQAGRRPALVMSERAYNERASLCLACPITSWPKGYKFEVPIREPLDKPGVILADHIRSMDWSLRTATFIARAPQELIVAVQARLRTLLRLS